MNSTKELTISVIVGNSNSWIIPYAKRLEDRLSRNHNVKFYGDHEEISRGDIAFYLGCMRITPKNILDRNKHNLVVHESNLPEGKGFSPLTWQVLEGKNRIPIVLFEAVEELDAGPIYLKDELVFEGHELIDEMREQQGNKTIELCSKFIDMYPDIIHMAKPQNGQESSYERRTPKDSRLDTDKTITEQFNLLRTVDNTKYPAYFELNGYRYFLKIIKEQKVKK